MDQTVTDRIEERLKSAFPAGAIERVQVLEYGDDPKVEPGETAVRAFIARAGRPEGEADKETVTAFEEANHPAIRKLPTSCPASSGGSSSCLSGQTGRPGPIASPSSASQAAGGRTRTPEEVSEELTPVMTRLGPADLATVDTLITAGIANSRAEVLRWAVGRIREHPAYAQLQERVRDIDQLKAQF